MLALPHAFSLSLPWCILSKHRRPVQIKAKDKNCGLLGLIIITFLLRQPEVRKGNNFYVGCLSTFSLSSYLFN